MLTISEQKRALFPDRFVFNLCMENLCNAIIVKFVLCIKYFCSEDLIYSNACLSKDMYLNGLLNFQKCDQVT